MIRDEVFWQLTLDTGPLVAINCERDAHHATRTELLKRVVPPLRGRYSAFSGSALASSLRPPRAYKHEAPASEYWQSASDWVGLPSDRPLDDGLLPVHRDAITGRIFFFSKDLRFLAVASPAKVSAK